MGLLKCPDCGSEVSERVKACPKCGCPIEFCKAVDDGKTVEKRDDSTNKEIQAQTKKAETFRIGNGIVQFDTDLILFRLFRCQFEENASHEKMKFYDYYQKNVKLYSDIFTKGLEYVENVIYEYCSMGAKLIYELDNKIDYYDAGRIYKFLVEQYPLEQYLQFVANQRAELEAASDKLKQVKREQRNMSGGWVGGGFGVKGAIKGALTASVMNAGTKMVRGVAFGAANQYTQSGINKRKQDLPNDIRTVLSLKEALYQGICNVGECIYQIYTSERKIPMVNIDVDKTVSRVKFAVEGFNANRLSKEEATDKICQSISENPYYFWFYRELYVMNKSEKEEILRLADYLGLYYEIYRIISNIDEGKKNWDAPEISYKH